MESWSRLQLSFFACIGLSMFVGGCGSEVQVENKLNVAPTVVITTPLNGDVFAQDQAIEFLGTVGDTDGLDDVQSAIWTSDIEGELDAVAPDKLGVVRLDTTLSAGVHTVELRVTDIAGIEAVASVTVEVQSEGQVPSVVIIAPQDNGSYVAGLSLDLVGSVSDLQQAADTLTVVWSYEPGNGGASTVIDAGNADAAGETVAFWNDADTPSSWKITLEATDSDNNTGIDEVFVILQDPMAIDQDGDGYPGALDCDDSNQYISPGNVESCNDIDDDCSGEIDDKDLDGDLHVDEDCVNYPGPLPIDDCDDNQIFVYPSANEQADGADNDCDGFIDEGTTLFDDDGDCYCEHPSICNDGIDPTCLVLGHDDCDDNDIAMGPFDNDFDGYTPCEGDCDDTDPTMNLNDQDNDGFSPCDGDCNDFDPLVIPANC